MNDENPAVPQLSEPGESTSEITFDAPSVLIDARMVGGHVVKTIREGRSQQVEMTAHTEWVEAAADEREKVFAIRSQNVINFAGQRLSVINDETTLDDKHYPATNPTAEQYLALVGQKVLIHFACTKDNMESKRLQKPVYKVVRCTIKLP